MVDQIFSRNPETFGKQLWFLKNQKMLCDSTLVVNGERIAIHSVVLASSSEYFRSLFVESAIKEITFKDVDKETMYSLIEYCYTGKIKITEENASEIFAMANSLSIVTIFEIYSSTLEKNLNESNSLSTWKIARMGNLEQLTKAAFEYSRKNFGKIFNMKDFLNLEYLDVLKLLGSKLNDVPVLDVYNAVKIWINHDIDSRKIHLNDLLGFVELSRLPHDFLMSESLSLCNLDVMCFRKIIEAHQKLSIIRSEESTELSTLLVVGGFKVEAYNKLEIFDTVSQEWNETDININRKQFATIFFEDKLVMIGGVSENKSISTVECFNLKTKKMETLSSMKNARHRLGAVKCKDHIYAIGGVGNSGSVAYVERWDPQSNTWQDVAPLNVKRQGCGAVVVDDVIFVIGGFGGGDLNSIEAFDPSSNTWTFRKAMNERRQGPGVASIGAYIYVVGGWDLKYLSSVERYDTKNDNWTIIQAMGNIKGFPAVGILMGKLVVTGGYINSMPSSLVEMYDIENNKWEYTKPLKNPRYDHNIVEIPWSLAKSLLPKK